MSFLAAACFTDFSSSSSAFAFANFSMDFFNFFCGSSPSRESEGAAGGAATETEEGEAIVERGFGVTAIGLLQAQHVRDRTEDD